MHMAQTFEKRPKQWDMAMPRSSGKPPKNCKTPRHEKTAKFENRRRHELRRIFEAGQDASEVADT